MTGYISSIKENKNGIEYGFISGDDGNSYYFNSKSLKGKLTMTDCDKDDEVEFIPATSENPKSNGRAREVVLLKNMNDETDIFSPRDIEKKQNSIIKYFTPGFAVHLDKKYAYEQYLKPDSGEDVIIDKISEVLYISRLGYHIIDQRSRYQFCMAGSTEFLKQFIRESMNF